MRIHGYKGEVKDHQVCDKDRDTITDTVAHVEEVKDSSCEMVSADMDGDDLCVEVDTTVVMDDFPEYHNDANALYRDLCKKQADAKESGAVDHHLNEWAVEHDAPDLQGCQVETMSNSEPTVVAPDSTGSESSSSGGLTDGASAGIAIAVIVVVAAAAAVLYYMCRGRLYK
jgi:hypothetical protein